MLFFYVKPDKSAEFEAVVETSERSARQDAGSGPQAAGRELADPEVGRVADRQPGLRLRVRPGGRRRRLRSRQGAERRARRPICRRSTRSSKTRQSASSAWRSRDCGSLQNANIDADVEPLDRPGTRDSRQGEDAIVDRGRESARQSESSRRRRRSMPKFVLVVARATRDRRRRRR